MLRNFFSQEIKKIRKEAELANNLIGTKKLFFENLPALNLNLFPLYKISNILDKYINKIQPEVIFLPSKNDIHEDQNNFKAAKISLRTNKKSNLKNFIIRSFI